MGRIGEFSASFTKPQAGFIYATALALIITTLVVSIVLSQNGTLSKSLGSGMTGKEVVGLVGGVGVGLFTIFAAVILYYQQGKSNSPQTRQSPIVLAASSDLSESPIAPAELSDLSDCFPEGVYDGPVDLYGRGGIQYCYNGLFEAAADQWKGNVHFQCVTDSPFPKRPTIDGYFLTREGIWKRKRVEKKAFQEKLKENFSRQRNVFHSWQWQQLTQILQHKEEVTSREMFEALKRVAPISTLVRKEGDRYSSVYPPVPSYDELLSSPERR